MKKQVKAVAEGHGLTTMSLIALLPHAGSATKGASIKKEAMINTALKFDSMTRGEQFLFSDFQSLRQINQFFIRHTTKLRLNFRYSVFTDVPAGASASCGQHGLRPPIAIANFSHDRADYILGNGFAHSFALTVSDKALRFLPISEGTNWQATGAVQSAPHWLGKRGASAMQMVIAYLEQMSGL